MKLSTLLKSLFALSFISVVGCSSQAPSAPHKEMAMKSEAEMMKMMEEAGTPGIEHKQLASLEGTWIAESVWRMSPEGKVEKSRAVSTKSFVLNGLYLQENYDDSNSPHPFKGIGMIGYDKMAKEYVSTWFDTMSSATWLSKGNMTDGQVIAFSGGGSCPMTGGYKEVSSELQIINNQKHIYRMYDVTPEGEKFKSLEIVYTRS